MGKVAKLFRNGGSQAVRLPVEFRLDCTEVMVEQVGDQLVLRPIRSGWDDFFNNPEKAPSDFLTDRQQELAQERDLF